MSWPKPKFDLYEGILLAAFVWLSLSFYARERINDLSDKVRDTELEIKRDLLNRYVRFVQSEYALPHDIGPCETLTRAQFEAFKRPHDWAEIVRPAADPKE